MAKKKLTSTKNGRFLKKVHQLTEKDIFTSFAIASILLNILFFATIIVLTSTNTFDMSMYKAVRSQYCQNINGVKVRAQKLGSDEDAIIEWHVVCQSDDFQPFLKEAIEKYKAQFGL